MLKDAVISGLLSSGMDVTDFGILPTPALALGVAPAVAAEFSFLMGGIAIFGALVRAIPDLSAVSPEGASALALAAAAALVTGLAAIWLFVRMLKRQNFHLFAWYAWAVGAGFLLWLAVKA